MNIKQTSLVFLSIFSITFFGCESKKQNNPNVSNSPNEEITKPLEDPDYLYAVNATKESFDSNDLVASYDGYGVFRVPTQSANFGTNDRTTITYNYAKNTVKKVQFIYVNSDEKAKNKMFFKVLGLLQRKHGKFNIAENQNLTVYKYHYNPNYTIRLETIESLPEIYLNYEFE
ncbi:hypothetical protein [Emticicia sp. SJ17W-69]|uniref:hypothetical protein n=1 Tax=Emticicia sp. SJ17W-69 TaxID=3421657 RepID=UPI003EBB536B